MSVDYILITPEGRHSLLNEEDMEWTLERGDFRDTVRVFKVSKQFRIALTPASQSLIEVGQQVDEG